MMMMMRRSPTSCSMFGVASLLPILLLLCSASCIASATTTEARRNLETANANSYQPAGLQSGPDATGSSFAASLVYHSEDNTVTITGSTYGSYFNSPTDSPQENSGCFFATATLPPPDSNNNKSAKNKGAPFQMEWLQFHVISEPAITESCNSLLQHKGRLFAGGYTEKGGVLESLRNKGGVVNTKQFGMILDLEFSNNADKTEEVTLNGGRVLQESEVVYPVAMASSPSDDYIYLVTMETSDTSRNAMADDPKFKHADPTHYFTYGSGFGMSIERILVKNIVAANTTASTTTGQMQSSLREDWRETYVTNGGETVHVADIAKISNDILIVVGTTTGYGPAFGAGPDIGGIDMDGFVTKLRTDVGTPYRDWENPEANPSTTRIQSVNQRDDWIMGICHDSKDPLHFYLVGATQGQLGVAVAGSTADPSIQAYLMKMELSSLEPVWTTQIGADASASNATVALGGSCAVTGDGKTVYFGGVVKDDAFIPGAGVVKSFGGDDLFVAKIDSQDGVVDWIRQVGTPGHDAYAMTGLTTDSAGNAILLGNTGSNLYRRRSAQEDKGISDVFLMTISRYNGDFQRPGGAEDIFDTENKAPPDTVAAPNSSSTNEDSSSKSGKYTGMLAFLLASIAAVSLAAVYVGRRMPREVNTDRSKILNYLHEFDVEDIDLKHSAMGGWHCNYANSLADGVNTGPAPMEGGLLGNTAANADFAPLTSSNHSNILEDSLFMDEDEPATLGGQDGSSGSGRTSGYGGLVDAYNNSSRDSRGKPSRDSRGKPSRESRGNSSRDSKGSKTATWGRDIV